MDISRGITGQKNKLNFRPLTIKKSERFTLMIMLATVKILEYGSNQYKNLFDYGLVYNNLT